MYESDADFADFDLPLFRPALRLDALADTIHAAADHIGDGAPASRDEVGAQVVLPIFEQLGWDIEDPVVVARGFGTRRGAVDFALCHPEGNPRLLAGIGPPPERRSAREKAGHPFNDLSLRALQVGISEDGGEWRFYFPAGRGRLHNREFARAHLTRDGAVRAADVLDTYASHFALRNGWALRRAELEYRDRSFPVHAQEAWRRALAGDEIMDRFAAEIEAATGVSPDPEEAAEFVRGYVEGLPRTPNPPDPVPSRRVGLGDRVWVYDLAAGDLDCYYLVAADPDFERNEVTAESPIGRVLMGAREGETRETRLPNGTHWAARIVFIRHGRTD